MICVSRKGTGMFEVVLECHEKGEKKVNLIGVWCGW